MSRLTVFAAIAVATTVSGHSTAAPPLDPGGHFPLIPLPWVDRSEDKGLHTLRDFRGQKTVVHIFAGW